MLVLYKKDYPVHDHQGAPKHMGPNPHRKRVVPLMQLKIELTSLEGQVSLE